MSKIVADRKLALLARSRKSTFWTYFAYVHELMSKIVIHYPLYQHPIDTQSTHTVHPPHTHPHSYSLTHIHASDELYLYFLVKKRSIEFDIQL